MLMMDTVAARSSTSQETRMPPACSLKTPLAPHATVPGRPG
jgi:hypothetical protein